uniref:Uncharacterized protein n=1 Tax=viral metagenome TaxID=1070528 RepID=A0A6H1ZC75_9ZZZZ
MSKKTTTQEVKKPIAEKEVITKTEATPEKRTASHSELLTTKGRFSLYAEKDVFVVKDVLGRVLCSCENEDAGMKKLRGFAR